MNIALITAAGIGSRSGLMIPKQFYCINTKPIFIYTLEVFEKNENIDSICLVYLDGWKEAILKWLKEYCITKVKYLTTGGNSFNESIKCGVDYLYNNGIPKDSHILIHESVRPMVSQRIINAHIKASIENDCVGTVIKSRSVIFHSINNTIKDTSFPRSEARIGQSPNTFKLEFLHEIYQYNDINDFVATISLINKHKNKKIYLIEGDEFCGIKITTNNDIIFFELLKDYFYKNERT